MSNIRVSRRVNKDARTIWRILADYGGISKFNPFLSHSALIGEQAGVCGVGTRRQCDMKFGNAYLREKVVDWKEGESYTVHIYESMMPVVDLFTTIGVADAGESQSLTYVTSSYKPKFGVAGALLDALFLRRLMRFMFSRMLKGLEAYGAKDLEVGTVRAAG